MRKGAVFLAALAVLLSLGCSSAKRIRVDAPPSVSSIIDRAQDLIGTPYCTAGVTPDCFDCSGFVGYCFVPTGVPLPRTSRELFNVGQNVSRSDLAAGDLVFFSTSNSIINHVGIFLADTRFIHSSTSNGVMISSLEEPYWKQRYKGARRVTSDK
ncbi:MAG: NlpC/P60 family protein [Candidatus Kapabacteria bacterium]|nr:NlpC/P60 family protein [Candidatus Kapabacteria bacterium]